MACLGSPTKSTKGAKGWTSKIYFDPEADKTEGRMYFITDDKLLKKMKKLVDLEEKILNVAIYKAPIEKDFLSEIMAGTVYHHQYVVFETKGYFWSIEKNREGLTVQRSKNESSVLRRYRQELRFKISGVERIVEDEGRRTMGQFIDWLWQEDLLNEEYNLATSNCQHFATLVFNEIALSKTV